MHFCSYCSMGVWSSRAVLDRRGALQLITLLFRLSMLRQEYRRHLKAFFSLFISRYFPTTQISGRLLGVNCSYQPRTGGTRHYNYSAMPPDSVLLGQDSAWTLVRWKPTYGWLWALLRDMLLTMLYSINIKAFWYAQSGWNTLMDVIVLVLPIPLIMKLQMNRRAKLGLLVVFILGALYVLKYPDSSSTIANISQRVHH